MLKQEEISNLEAKPKQTEKSYGSGIAWTVLVISLAITALAWKISSSYVEKRTLEKFEFKAKEINQAIQEQMLLYEQVLRSGVAFFDSSSFVSREEWRIYVEKLNLERNWPGIQGLGYSVPIKPDELEKHIAEIRDEGFPDFTVRPEGKRDLYSSIVYLEPFDWRNKRAFGYDMWSNDLRRSAMATAMKTGEAAASGLITLKQETDTNIQKGFLLYLPVYTPNSSVKTIEDRSKNLKGWVYAAFRTEDLMNGIIQSREAPLDNLTYMEIYDGSVNKDSLLFSSNKTGGKFKGGHKPLNSKEISINIQGREWLVYIYEEQNPDSKDFLLPWYIAIAGVFIDLLLFYVILSISSVQKKAVNLAKEISSEVEVKKNELELLNSELEINEERIKAIVDSTVDGIITVDSKGLIQTYNKACIHLFGHEREEVIGQSIKVLLPKSISSQLDAYLQEGLEAGKSKITGLSQEIECKKKDGRPFQAFLSLNVLIHKNEKIFIGTIRDITEQKNADAQIKQTLQELRVKTTELESSKEEAIIASKSKSEFLANMSHEIRTPMTAILGYIDLLKENEHVKFTEALEQVKIIERNGDHLLTIINDILDLSKIEAGKLELEYAPFCVHELTSNIQNLLNAKVEEKSIKLDIKIVYPIPETFTGDLTRIRQILLNLLGNAIKFTQKGSVSLFVNWSSELSELSFSVSDTGIGMTQEQCDKVFNSFEQADTSITRNFGGTGLGLAITKRLTKMMGGKISVKSEYGRGSQFTVSIKIRSVSKKLLSEKPQIKTKVELKNNNTTLEGHVLLVDDNMTNLTLIGKILKKMNLKVECCMNGEEATKLLLTENNFDLVLMDVQMPVMDGLTAARILKQNNFSKPVIALTANNMKGDKERCLEAGYCNFASKPVNRKKLFDMLSSYLGH